MKHTEQLPKSYNGCTCICHTVPGVKHIAACCGAIFSSTDTGSIPVTPEEEEYWQERERRLKEKQL